MVCFAYTGLNLCELETICLIFGHILNLKIVDTVLCYWHIETVAFVGCYLWNVGCIVGFELSFWSAVFITSVGHLREFPSAKGLTGLCGMCVGCGEIVGLCICFSVF